MNCPNCDAENPGTFKYCGQCATELSTDSISLTTGVDTVAELASFVSSLLPVIGGPVSNVISGFTIDRKFNRVRDVLVGLATELSEIRSEVAEDYVRSDEFEELLEKTLRQIADERNEEKRDLYRKFLVGAITSPGDTYDQQIRFLRTMEELQGDHITVLKAFIQAPGSNPGIMGSVMGTLKNRIPDFDEHHIKDLVSELVDMRVLVDANVGITMTGKGAEQLASRITQYGSRLTAYITG